ncbi:nitroreductase [Ornithinibacillus sp. L9]|uniref:Nitroreductase n=1 Tax=Ornithinibacillus caprae TaxID=2678566 RepID=A0A6N8FID6_9BACI|nr:nitroreductase [Ornithinibacillus caprae]MUK89193.1 nitroreductase [Ornithinibacillus caprae]
MTILDTIKKRRSIYNFKEVLVDTDILKEIFSFGSYAPSHYMKEPWNIMLYQEEGRQPFVNAIIESYQRIGMIKPDNEPKTLKMIESMKQFLLAIPHHAVIYFEREEDPVRYEEEYAAVCAFIQNSQLAAWEYGVGMLWTITPYMHDPEFYEAIELDAKRVKIAAVLQIGYPKAIPRDKGRTSIEEKMKIIDT